MRLALRTYVIHRTLSSLSSYDSPRSSPLLPSLLPSSSSSSTTGSRLIHPLLLWTSPSSLFSCTPHVFTHSLCYTPQLTTRILLLSTVYLLCRSVQVLFLRTHHIYMHHGPCLSRKYIQAILRRCEIGSFSETLQDPRQQTALHCSVPSKCIFLTR